MTINRRKFHPSNRPKGQNFSSGSIIKTSNPAARKWSKGKEQLTLAATEKNVGKEGHVYIFDIGYGNLYKIGCAKNPQNRLKELKAANPLCRCIWSAWVKDMRAVESALHEKYRKLRVQREIFRLEFQHIALINEFVNKIQESYLQD